MRLADRIRKLAHETGFDLVGFAAAQPPGHSQSFRNWLDQGFAGDMSWLARNAESRADPGQFLPGAKSVVVVGKSYYVQDPPPELWKDPLRGRISRYAWGPDYHDVILPLIRHIADFIVRESGGNAHFRACVDSGPVLEREIAAAAGLGFVGRNTNLISAQFGSYIFIGEIIVDVELDQASDPEIENRQLKIENPSCGRCRRCLDTCPTHAFPGEYVLNASRCISYLTIENKGAIPEELRPLMGNWIFGCDECQQVCPWTLTYSRPSRASFLRYDPEACVPRLLELIEMDEAAFRRRFQGTAVLRAKRQGLLRNVAVALGNSGDAAALPALEIAARDPDPLVKEHAEWAVERLRTSNIEQRTSNIEWRRGRIP
jgi:epoxyqueuosine reductase